MPYRPEQSLGFTSIATSTTAKALLSGITPPDGFTKVRFTVFAQPVYFRTDGTAPTSTVGIAFPVNSAAGNVPYEKYWNLDYLKTVQVVAGGTGTIAVEWIREF